MAARLGAGRPFLFPLQPEAHHWGVGLPKTREKDEGK